MTALKNDRLLRSLLRQPVDVTPIWIMRQAGRYLPEYRETRAKAGSFIKLCTTPELACEVTLQPLRRFALDAAILFSDILTVPDAMGLGLYFADGEGPRFKNPVRSEADIARLGVPDPEAELRYVTDAVRLIRRELDGEVPLIGFSGSPWTLACYMVEGGGSDDFARVKTLAYDEPALMHRLLDVNARAVTAYLNAQIAAGVQAVMITREHEGRRVPVIVFTKNGGQWLEAIAACGADALGLDWTADIADARRRVGAQVALQGNMDPAMLRASAARIREEAAAILAAYGRGSGHVFNLGHGITPDIAPEKLATLIDAVHELSRPYHD
jgi:uroporphyrinogen decarboxylase